jgi:hypothetical protein
MSDFDPAKKGLGERAELGVNLLKNANFAEALTGWEHSPEATFGMFPGEDENLCALLVVIPGGSAYVRQLVSPIPPGRYQMSFRYVLRGLSGKSVRVGILIGGVTGAVLDVVLHASPDEKALGFFHAVEVGQVGTPLVSFTAYHEAEPRELFIDDIMFAILDPAPTRLVQNGDFDDYENKAWSFFGEASVVEMMSHPSHHLELRSAAKEDAGATQTVKLAHSGTYRLTFKIKNGISGPLPSRKGVVCLGAHTFDFVLESPDEQTKTFDFEISDDDLAQAQALDLRIAKSLNDGSLIEFWYIDDVKLIDLGPARN